MWKRKFSNVLLIFFLLGAATQSVLGGPTIDDYCEKGPEKLPCSTKCELGADCGDASDNEWAEMPQGFRDTMLKEHNTIRNQVAKGEHAPEGRKRRQDEEGGEADAGGKPVPKQFPATPGGMKVLSYSKELEFLALCHARSCKNEGATGIMQDGSDVGLNVYDEEGEPVAEDGEPAAEPEGLLTNVIPAWMDQASTLAEPIGVFAAATEATLGYVSQVVWGATTKVGCAKVHYVANEKNHWLVACAYSPKGNVDGEKCYDEAAEECADKNAEYDGLCGEIVADDDFTFPALPGAALKVAVAWSTITYFVWYLALALF